MSFSKPVSSELRGDFLMEKAALPNTTTNSSNAFTHAGIMNGLEIVIAAGTAISISASKTLSVDLYHCDTENGTFTKAAPIVSFTGAKSFVSGAEITRFVPCSTVKRFMKLYFTADEDLSAAKVEAWLVHKG